MKEHEENRREPGGIESCQHRLTSCGLIIPVILLLLALSVAEQRASAQDQISAVVVNSWFKFYGPHDFRRSQYPYFSSSNGCGPDIMRETVLGSALNKMLNEVTLNVDERSIKISFANLCNAHDRCYMTMGKTKAECDRDLNQAMSEHCSKLEVGFQSKCTGVGENYMRSIRVVWGDKSFRISQEKQKRYESIIAENTPELRAHALKTSQISAAKSEGGGGYSEVDRSFTGSSGSYSSVSRTARSTSMDDRKPLTLKGQGAI